MSADYSRVHRLLGMITLMQQRDAGNAAALAQRFDVDERTIYRDLKVLENLGIPCHFDEETRDYRIRRDFFLPPVQLTPAEALALLTLAKQVGAAEQMTLTGPAAQAMEKIRGQLPDHVLKQLGDVDHHINIRLPADGPAVEAIRDVFQLVQQAIHSRRALCCTYESLSGSGLADEFLLRPYALSFDQRAWYVIGHHDGRGEVRRLKLNRFHSVATTSKPYAIPDDFSMDAFRGKAWRMIRGDRVYRVTIAFDVTVAETVSDTNWHATQQIDLHEDGSITFTCEVEGLDEIVWWVLGYGPHATVREPVELVERVAALARATAAGYDARSESTATTPTIHGASDS